MSRVNIDQGAANNESQWAKSCVSAGMYRVCVERRGHWE